MFHIPIVHAHDVSKQIPREKDFPSVCVLLNNWFIRQLCVHRDMKHLGSLESTQEARVALSYASSNFYASFVLSKLPAFFTSRWTHLLITQLLSNTHTYRFDSHLSLCLPENRLKIKKQNDSTEVWINIATRLWREIARSKNLKRPFA